jgi:crotonobetainyl-CoA:carnitine CoA-transferase CaiB-like acyl-CoA transferase
MLLMLVCGSLEGILVADYSRALAGPLATMLLGDLGADVIKVERKGVGDESRAWGPFVDGDSSYFLSVNRNKRSLELDLLDEGDRLAAQELARRADVVVENFRPASWTASGLATTLSSGRTQASSTVQSRPSAPGVEHRIRATISSSRRSAAS